MKRVFAVFLILLAVGTISCCRPCRKSKSIVLQGVKWELLEMNNRVVDRESKDRADRLTLTLGDDGRAAGKGDCNGFFGPYTLSGNRISFGNVASTRMLCANQALENEYVQTLQKAAGISIDGDFLLLMDETGAIVLSFRKISE